MNTVRHAKNKMDRFYRVCGLQRSPWLPIGYYVNRPYLMNQYWRSGFGCIEEVRYIRTA